MSLFFSIHDFYSEKKQCSELYRQQKKLIIVIGYLLLPFAPSFAQSTWKKTTQKLIVKQPPFQQCHASTLVALDTNKLMAAWFGGTHEGSNDVVIWTSILEKGNWSHPLHIADGRMNDTLQYPTWNPVLFKEKKGTLYLFYKVGPNPMQWWGMMKHSNDNGKTWSEPIPLPDGFLGPIKNKPIQVSDGTILSPSSTETTTKWRVHIERTTDEGKTWEYIPVDTSGTAEVIQPSILQYSDGRLQLVCRSKQGYVMQSWSSDNGKTWGAFAPTSLLNPNSGTDAITLQSGLQLIVYNPDTPGKDWWDGRGKLRVAISQEGTNWTDIAILEDGTTEEFSYPAVVQTTDGKVHISYTYNRKNIKYVVLEAMKD